MTKPEWLKKLLAKISETETKASDDLTAHEETANIHRAILVGTTTPSNDTGNDGDIFIVYEE